MSDSNDIKREEPSREEVIAEGSDIAGRSLAFAEAVAVLIEAGYGQDDPILKEWANDGR